MDANIFRHALGITMSTGVLIAVLLLAFTYVVLELAFRLIHGQAYPHPRASAAPSWVAWPFWPRRAGYRVTGSDQNTYPPMSTLLEAEGIELTEGYDPAQLDPRPDLVIIGNALSRGNPAVEAVLNQGIDYVSGPRWLGENYLREQDRAGGGRHPRQNHHRQHAGVDTGTRRAGAGLPDWRCTP